MFIEDRGEQYTGSLAIRRRLGGCESSFRACWRSLVKGKNGAETSWIHPQATIFTFQRSGVPIRSICAARYTSWSLEPS